MRFSICSPFKSILVAAVFSFSGATFAQSLSIRKQGESTYAIEASAPASNPHTLQASENLHLWIDLQENVTEAYSHTLTNAGNFRYFRLKPSETVPPIRVMLLGDSLTQDGSGWGGGIYGYFKPNATVINYGMANTSTKIFLRSAEKENMLLVKPNYVLMNYGFIDNVPLDLGGTTLEEFEANLKTLIQMVRGFGGVPIMVAVQMPRIWDVDGKLVGGWMVRNEVTRRVAAEFNAPYIDFEQLTREVYEDLGPTRCAFMNLRPEDFMHFSPLGAKYISRLIVNALPDYFGPYLTGIFDAPPIP
jgi:lysophospholipase L1-like esterase